MKVRAVANFSNDMPDMVMRLDHSRSYFFSGQSVIFFFNSAISWGPIAQFEWLTACGFEDPRIGGQLSFVEKVADGSTDVELKIGPGEADGAGGFYPTACNYSLFSVISFTEWRWVATYGTNTKIARGNTKVGISVGGDISVLDGLGSSSVSGATGFKISASASLEWLPGGADPSAGPAPPPIGRRLSAAGDGNVLRGSVEIDIAHEGGFVLDIVPNEIKDMLRTKNFIGKLSVSTEVPYLNFIGYIREPKPFELWPGLLNLSNPNLSNPRLGPTYGIRIVQCYKNCERAAAYKEEVSSATGIVDGLLGGEDYINCASSGDDFAALTARRRLVARETGAWHLRNATGTEESILMAPSANGWRRYMRVADEEPQSVTAVVKSFGEIDGGRRQLQTASTAAAADGGGGDGGGGDGGGGDGGGEGGDGDSDGDGDGDDDGGDEDDGAGDCYAKPQFLPFWIAKACLDLDDGPSCGTFQVSALLSSAERIFTISGSFVGGDIKPLWFLPGGLADSVIIEANAKSPLVASMEIDLTPGGTRELTFALSSRIKLTVFDHTLKLDCRVYGIVALRPVILFLLKSPTDLPTCVLAH